MPACNQSIADPMACYVFELFKTVFHRRQKLGDVNVHINGIGCGNLCSLWCSCVRRFSAHFCQTGFCRFSTRLC